MNAMTDTHHAASARSIGAILIDSGRLTPEAAARILEVQKEEGLRFGDAAIRLGLLTEEDIQQALVPAVQLPVSAARRRQRQRRSGCRLPPLYVPSSSN